MSEIIYIILVIVAFISSLFPGDIIPEKNPENFEAVSRFMVCSDTHISSPDDFKLDRIKDAISLSYDIASNDKDYKKLDAVIFVGDITDSGTDEQFDAFGKTVKNVVRPGTEILAVAAFQHDSWTNGKKCLEKVSSITGKDSDFHAVINGFHFIGLSTSEKDNTKYDISQRIWLEKQLREAKNDGPDRPVFVFHHEHTEGTVYGSENWGTGYFKDILFRYPQVVHFSGHSHYPLNDPRSIWQGRFTAVGTGSLNYMEFKIDGEEPIHPAGCENTAQIWIVEVGKDNTVRLMGYDAINSYKLCEYYVTCPAKTSSNVYSPRNRRALASAPEFENGAAISVSPDGDKYNISVPAAKSTDGMPVFLYRLAVTTPAGNQVLSDYVVNNFWQRDIYETVTFTIPVQKGDMISVIAENSYEMQSKALTCVIE